MCNKASEGQGHAGSGDQTGLNKATLKLLDYDCSFEQGIWKCWFCGSEGNGHNWLD